MVDRFQELLNQLSVEIGLTLHPDKIGACTLKTREDFEVRLECDPRQENLLLAIFICEVPPGKFRENILKDALKSNAFFPQIGTLAYSDRNHQLTLFTFAPLPLLNGAKLAELLNAFIDKAYQWRTAVESGTTATLVATSSKSSSGMFGLTP